MILHCIQTYNMPRQTLRWVLFNCHVKCLFRERLPKKKSIQFLEWMLNLTKSLLWVFRGSEISPVQDSFHDQTPFRVDEKRLLVVRVNVVPASEGQQKRGKTPLQLCRGVQEEQAYGNVKLKVILLFWAACQQCHCDCHAFETGFNCLGPLPTLIGHYPRLQRCLESDNMRVHIAPPSASVHFKSIITIQGSETSSHSLVLRLVNMSLSPNSGDDT